jgi:hypothetical protein
MKRTISLVICVLLSVVSSYAGDKLSFSFLKGETSLSYVVDWSNMTINGLGKSDWIERRNAEQPDYDAEKEYESELLPRINDFVAKANAEMENVNLFLSAKAGHKYTVYLYPQNIKSNGDNTIECAIKETATGKTMVEFVVNGRGGTFGSMSNLWGDGMRSSGKKFGKFICKHLGYDPSIKDKIDDVFSRVGIK